MPKILAWLHYTTLGLDYVADNSKAIILKGQELRQKKWEIESRVANAKTFDEIMAIKVEL